jgi:hypothetical protein
VLCPLGPPAFFSITTGLLLLLIFFIEAKAAVNWLAVPAHAHEVIFIALAKAEEAQHESTNVGQVTCSCTL